MGCFFELGASGGDNDVVDDGAAVPGAASPVSPLWSSSSSNSITRLLFSFSDPRSFSGDSCVELPTRHPSFLLDTTADRILALDATKTDLWRLVGGAAAPVAAAPMATP